MINIISNSDTTFKIGDNIYPKAYNLMVSTIKGEYVLSLVNIYDCKDIIFSQIALSDISISGQVSNTVALLQTAFNPFRVNFNSGEATPTSSNAIILVTEESEVNLDSSIITSNLLIYTIKGDQPNNTWLPDPADFPGLIILFTNRSSEIANINSFEEQNTIFAAEAMNNIEISAGSTYRIFSDGEFFIIQ